MDGAISAIITGMIALLVCLLNNYFQYRSSAARYQQSVSLIEYKINELAIEVREHNNFARRMPVIEEQIKVINHRLEDLERKEK